MSARVIFAGTSQFAVPSLEALIDIGYKPLIVLTQPDRRAGRGRQLQASPVKRLALAHGIPVKQPIALQDPAIQAHIAALAPDVMIVAAYGLLLPGAVLDIPKRGCINVHGSVLPRWRGAAPIPRAIEAGDTQTGITLMQMDSGLDTGPILAITRIPINTHDTSQSLHDRLMVAGAQLLVERFPDILNGRVTPIPQDDSEATYAPKLSKDEARVDWSSSTDIIVRKIHALNPWPVAQTHHDSVRIRVWDAELGSESTSEAPGTITGMSANGLGVACGNGTVVLTRLQRDGSRPMAAAEFVNGHPLPTGARLTPSI